MEKNIFTKKKPMIPKTVSLFHLYVGTKFGFPHFASYTKAII